MRVTTTLRAEGQVTLAGVGHAVELVDVETEAWDQPGAEARRHVGYELAWRALDGGLSPLGSRSGARAFPTEAERAAWLAQTASGAELVEVERPEPVERPHPLAGLVGQYLAGVEFVIDESVCLRFQPGGHAPVPPGQGLLVFVHAPLLLAGGQTLGHGEPGYADGLAGLVADSLAAVDQYLDTGLDLAFSGGRRLSLPLGPWPGGWAELVTYRDGDGVHVWLAGEPPFDASPPPP